MSQKIKSSPLPANLAGQECHCDGDEHGGTTCFEPATVVAWIEGKPVPLCRGCLDGMNGD